MSDLNDFLKVIAEAKAQDPKHQKIKQVKENVKSDLGSLFQQLGSVVAVDPKKKMIDGVKESVKSDLNSLFSQLSTVKSEPIIEASAEEKIDELVQEVQAIEAAEEALAEEIKQEEPTTSKERQQGVEKYLSSLPKDSHPFQQPIVDTTKKDLKVVTDKLKFLEQWVAKISAAGPGSGEVNFRYLDDVDRSTITDGYFLTYNADTKKFEFRAIAISGDGTPHVQSDWTETNTGSAAYIKHKPTLFSGSYTDLTDTPTIPTVPTTVSSFTNDAEYVDSTTLNTALNSFVNNASFQLTLGDYATKAYVAAQGYLTTVSWNDVTSKPTLFSGSYTDLTNKPTIPSLTGYATETFVNTAISNLIGAAPDALNTLKEIADQLAADESAVSSLTTTVAGKVSLTGSYADPAWITSLAYGKLTGAPTLATVATTGSYTDLTNKPTLFSGSYTDLTNKPTIPTVPTNVSAFTNDSGYLSSVSWSQVTNKPDAILTLNDTNVVSNDMLVNKSITIGDVTVTLGQVITALTGLTGVTSNAATAFVAGPAAESNVALQMPRESALRNPTNGFNNMYFDVSNGGSAHGAFQFRSSNGYTNVLTMSPTSVTFNTGATFTSRTPSVARTGFNSPIDTEIIVDEMRFRISNQGGIFPQVIGHGSSRNLAWTGIGAISGTAVTQLGSVGTIVASNAWTTLYNGHGLDSSGDTVTVTLQDKAAGRIYRVTFMRSDNGTTTGYNIIAERLL